MFWLIFGIIAAIIGAALEINLGRITDALCRSSFDKLLGRGIAGRILSGEADFAEKDGKTETAICGDGLFIDVVEIELLDEILED